MGLLFCVTAFLGVASAIDAKEPVYWGTFTQTHCDWARYGCRSFGTWVSDDGTITKLEISLDGDPGPDGTVRADYQPSGIINDADNNIVHTAMWSGVMLWLPWVLCLVCAVLIAGRTFAWRSRRR
jgi:hypothetical protein